MLFSPWLLVALEESSSGKKSYRIYYKNSILQDNTLYSSLTYQAS